MRCVSVALRSFFMDNQYPDEAKREEIANACNCVIQKPGTVQRPGQNLISALIDQTRLMLLKPVS